MNKGNNIAVDLGNNNTRFTNKENSFFSEPSIVALQGNAKSLRAVGRDAFNMEGKVNGQLKVIRPMRAGVIADLDSAMKMLNALVKKIYPGRSSIFGFQNIIAGIPYSTTEVERRALRVALGQFTAKRRWLIYEPLAAAIGMGLDIKDPDGKFVIDIGGGITEIALISLSGIVTYQSLKTGGDAFNDDIKTFMERHYLLAISDKMAEKIKVTIGSASADHKPSVHTFDAIGKDLISGIPKMITINYREIAGVLDNGLTRIENAIVRTLEECPPELAGDIYSSGVHLTGGGALLPGLKERLEKVIKLEVHLAEDPLLSVSKGIEMVLTQSTEQNLLLFK